MDLEEARGVIGNRGNPRGLREAAERALADRDALEAAARAVIHLAIPSVTGTGAEIYEVQRGPIDELRAALGEDDQS